MGVIIVSLVADQGEEEEEDFIPTTEEVGEGEGPTTGGTDTLVRDHTP